MAKPRRQRRPRLERTPQPRSAQMPRSDGRADETLSELRRELELTQVQLAERMAVSRRAISHLEHEPNPRVAP